MSIRELREHCQEIPGSHQIIMSYEDGGKVQVFTMGDVVVKLGPSATRDEIKAALAAATRATS
jgi:hypothetical protein